MHDRGSIIWAPFNSVINGRYIVNSINKEKSKINKPVLDEEEIILFENMIKTSFANKIKLLFEVYSSGYIYTLEGTVLKIDSINKKITISGNKILYFCEIVNIRYLNF